MLDSDFSITLDLKIGTDLIEPFCGFSLTITTLTDDHLFRSSV